MDKEEAEKVLAIVKLLQEQISQIMEVLDNHNETLKINNTTVLLLFQKIAELEQNK